MAKKMQEFEFPVGGQTSGAIRRTVPLINVDLGGGDSGGQPMSDITLYARNGQKVSRLEQIEDYIHELMDYPLEFLFPKKIAGKTVSGNVKLKPPGGIKLVDTAELNKWADIMENRLADYIGNRVRNEDAATQFFSTIKDMNDIYGYSLERTNILDPEHAGYFGTFFEENIMGLSSSDSPKWDMPRLMTELKTKVEQPPSKRIKKWHFAKGINVGGFTVEYYNTNGLSDKAFDDLMVAFKMAQKMRNLFYVRLGKPLPHGKGYRSKFLEMSYFMILLIEKLMAAIKTNASKSAAGITISVSPPRVPRRGDRWMLRKTYTVTLSTTTVKGKYKWEDIYFRKLDILERIKRDRAFANRMFGALRNDPQLKLAKMNE